MSSAVVRGGVALVIFVIITTMTHKFAIDENSRKVVELEKRFEILESNR